MVKIDSLLSLPKIPKRFTSTVNETELKNYLSSVAAANDDCGTPSGTGSLNSDDSVNVCDFLSSWAVMVGVEDGSDATNYIQGAAWFVSEGATTTNAAGATVTSGTTEIPLSVGFTSGTGNVLYTSYHTNDSSTPTTEFLPQERVLQYLILNVLGSL